MGRGNLQFTRTQVAAFRLARNHLLHQAPTTPADVCRDVCGIQAQVFSAAELSLAARIRGLTKHAIHSALWEMRTLVKTSAMRSTLHLLATEDVPLYIAALKRSRLRMIHRVMGKYGGITPELANEVTRAAVRLLQRGPMTRGELTKLVLAKGFARGKARQFFVKAWWGVVRQAIVEGHVCYGPNQGIEVTVVHVKHWLPNLRPMEEDAAKRELLRRYLRAYGPATPQDFCKWSGTFGSEAQVVWKQLGPELAEVRVEGRRAWLLERDLPALRRSRFDGPEVRLLPNFDSYLLAHADKGHIVEPRCYKKIYRQAGWISPVVLCNGRAVGLWSLSAGRKEAQVSVSHFGRPSQGIATGIKVEAARLSNFLEMPCRLSEAVSA
jgi:hypothetical protein